jgi:hypothetical protein
MVPICNVPQQLCTSYQGHETYYCCLVGVYHSCLLNCGLSAEVRFITNSFLVHLECDAFYKMYWYHFLLFYKSLSHKSLVLFHDYSHVYVTTLVWYIDVDILEDPFASRTLVATY